MDAKGCSLAAGLLLAWACAPARAADGPGPLAVWTVPRGAAIGPGEIRTRTAWRLVPAEGPGKLPAGASLVVESPHLLAVLPAGGKAVSLYTKGPGRAGLVRQDLLLVGDGAAAGPLGKIELLKYTQAEASVGFSAGPAAARLTTGLGKCFVEIAPGKAARALRVAADARFAFLPDFFGGDVLYDAREMPVGKVYAPAENFLVSLLADGAAIGMLTWPVGGGQEAFLVCEGTGRRRRFAAAQVSFDGNSVFVAAIAREGIWHAEDLATAETDRTFLVDAWRPPFDAQWITLLARRPRPDAKTGLATETLRLRTLPAAGATPYSDVYVHPRVPSWLTAGRWRLHLQTTLTHMMTREKVRVPGHVVAINYPLDRVKWTPLDAFTLVDVMRGCLGTGPCEYVLDLEGLNRTRSTGAAGTGKPTAAATCSERGALVYYYLGERAETARRDEPVVVTDAALESVEKIKDFLDAAHGRIQEYLAWSREIVRLCEAARTKDPAAAALADRVVPIAREMTALWDKMVAHGKPCAFPAEWRLALDHCKDLIRRGAPDLGARIRAFDPQMRSAGEEVDGGMQACRRIVKRIRQAAAIAGSRDPKALQLAATIRRRCRDVLRNKHYKEGDTVRLSPARRAAR